MHRPIVSSGRAFSALWKRAYFKFAELLGGVVNEGVLSRLESVGSGSGEVLVESRAVPTPSNPSAVSRIVGISPLGTWLVLFHSTTTPRSSPGTSAIAPR